MCAVSLRRKWLSHLNHCFSQNGKREKEKEQLFRSIYRQSIVCSKIVYSHMIFGIVCNGLLQLAHSWSCHQPEQWNIDNHRWKCFTENSTVWGSWYFSAITASYVFAVNPAQSGIYSVILTIFTLSLHASLIWKPRASTTNNAQEDLWSCNL